MNAPAALVKACEHTAYLEQVPGGTYQTHPQAPTVAPSFPPTKPFDLEGPLKLGLLEKPPGDNLETLLCWNLCRRTVVVVALEGCEAESAASSWTESHTSIAAGRGSLNVQSSARGFGHTLTGIQLKDWHWYAHGWQLGLGGLCFRGSGFQLVTLPSMCRMFMDMRFVAAFSRMSRFRIGTTASRRTLHCTPHRR